MKSVILTLIAAMAFNAQAGVERFKLNDSEITEFKRAGIVKPVNLHEKCKNITAINMMSATGKVPFGKKVDLVLVSKKTRYTYLFSGSTLAYKFASTFGSGYKNGPKIQEGDGRTPEGVYKLDFKNYDSKFHSSIHVSYPSAYDKEFAKKYGVSPGGDIMIHGMTWFSGTGSNWTAGCIAMKNKDIDKLMNVVSIPTTVAICPL
jgi:murein L,D-transpeptidase YafK